MRPLIQELPRHYGRSPRDGELQRALTLLLEQTEGDLNFTLKQLFPSTTSGWGLKLWEEAYGIPFDPALTEDQRRSRILAKIKGQGMTTVEKIQSVAQAFDESPVEVAEHYADYFFEVWFTDTVGPVADEAGLRSIINELKPAHLDWAIRYRQTRGSPVYVGCLPRQGDKIIWKVDCT
ncbi:putative phage tail protein [Dysosmobacter sp.]|uniref:putative phage tail protein n=1 Tax=Dysosmobacter sp. TaxID=2591382 RepID=UPI003A913BEC